MDPFIPDSPNSRPPTPQIPPFIIPPSPFPTPPSSPLFAPPTPTPTPIPPQPALPSLFPPQVHMVSRVPCPNTHPALLNQNYTTIITAFNEDMEVIYHRLFRELD